MLLRKALLAKAGNVVAESGWSTIGLVAEYNFESSDGTDTKGSNDLSLTNTSIVAGPNGLALDTGTTGYAQNTTIGSSLDDIQATFDCYIRADLAYTQTTILSFASGVAFGGAADDEIVLGYRGTTAGASKDTLQITVISGGSVKISWTTVVLNLSSGFNRFTITADGNGNNVDGYKVYLNGNYIAIATRPANDIGYRGIWAGDSAMNSISNIVLAGIGRNVLALPGYGDYEFARLYNFVKDQTQITEEQTILGAEK